MITAYALAFGSLLLVGGKLGDLFGRKWTLIGGLTGFAIASAIGGLAQSFGMLVAARALQGAFGAMLAPSALGLLTVTFQGAADRAKAFGIFSAIAAGGALRRAAARRRPDPGDLVALVPVRQPGDRGSGRPRWRCGCWSTSASPVRPRIDLPGVVARPPAGCSRSSTGSRNAETTAWSDPITIVALAASAVLLTGFILTRAAGRAPAAAAAHRLGPGSGRRVRDDRAGGLGRVRRVPVPDLLHAAGPRLLPAEDRARVPADDGHDRPHRDDGADPRAAPHRRQAAGHGRHGARGWWRCSCSRA